MINKDLNIIQKKRVCELSPGDEFIYNGREKRVTSIGAQVRFVDESGSYSGISSKSKQWVELIPKHENVRAKFYRGEPVSPENKVSPTYGETLRGIKKRAAGIFIEKRGRENGYSF